MRPALAWQPVNSGDAIHDPAIMDTQAPVLDLTPAILAAASSHQPTSSSMFLVPAWANITVSAVSRRGLIRPIRTLMPVTRPTLTGQSTMYYSTDPLVGWQPSLPQRLNSWSGVRFVDVTGPSRPKGLPGTWPRWQRRCQTFHKPKVWVKAEARFRWPVQPFVRGKSVATIFTRNRCQVLSTAQRPRMVPVVDWGLEILTRPTI